MGNWDVDKAMQTLVEHGFIDKDGRPKQIASKLEDAELARDSEETCNNKQVASKLDASKDTISRQAMHIELEKWITYGEYKYSNATKYLYDRIDRLPTVTPKQRTGHWIECEDEVKCFCSECKEISDYPTKFCPNCGAKMVEPQKSDVSDGD